MAEIQAWHRAEIPAASGFGNARSVALVQSVMACGGTVRGVRLLSQPGCDRAWQEQFRGQDRVLGMLMRYGMGYGLFGSTYGWGGWGGSMVMIEPGARMAVSYVTNQMREPGDDAPGTRGHDGRLRRAAGPARLSRGMPDPGPLAWSR